MFVPISLYCHGCLSKSETAIHDDLETRVVAQSELVSIRRGVSAGRQGSTGSGSILAGQAVIAPVVARLDRAIPTDSGGFWGARIRSEHDEQKNAGPEQSK